MMLRSIIFCFCLAVGAAQAKDLTNPMTNCQADLGCDVDLSSMFRIANTDEREINATLTLYAAKGEIIGTWSGKIASREAVHKSAKEMLAMADQLKVHSARVTMDGRGFVQHVLWPEGDGRGDFPIPGEILWRNDSIS